MDPMQHPQQAEQAASAERPLHAATVVGDVDTMRSLLERGANVDEQDNLGRTPLMLAVRAEATADPVVRLLLQWGADPFIADQAGETPATVARSKSDASLSTLFDRVPGESRDPVIAKGGSSRGWIRVSIDERSATVPGEMFMAAGGRPKFAAYLASIRWDDDQGRLPVRLREQVRTHLESPTVVVE